MKMPKDTNNHNKERRKKAHIKLEYNVYVSQWRYCFLSSWQWYRGV